MQIDHCNALLGANFRDEYYALVPAVSDDADGPRFVTSGLIDPGRSLWGERPVKFAKRAFRHPRVDLAKLDGRFADWARHKLVPKVLVANQTSLVEAVADPDGAWIPGVPITSIVPLSTGTGATKRCTASTAIHAVNPSSTMPLTKATRTSRRR